MSRPAIYCNEFDPAAAAWLRQLMADGLIPKGEVDERSITDVPADHLRDARRAHFFAGIGGWERALELAGWPADRSVWTGSCPCQPFSSAGKRKAEADPRDLWPEFLRLITGRRPPVVFGEQVASSDVVGKAGGKPGTATRRVWVDRVRADLEAAGYAFGACVLGAHSVGAPHIRQRLYWVARDVGDTSASRLPSPEPQNLPGTGRREEGRAAPESGGSSGAGHCELAHADEIRRRPGRRHDDAREPVAAGHGPDGELARPDGQRVRRHPGAAGAESGAAPLSGERAGQPTAVDPVDGRAARVVGDADSSGPQPWLFAAEANGHGRAAFPDGGVGDADREREAAAGPDGAGPGDALRAGQAVGFWGDFQLVPCRDGAARRVEPGAFPLAHGVPRELGPLVAWLERMGVDPKAAKRTVRNFRGRLAQAGRNRVGRLRGYGNAIVPEIAAAFVRAFLDAEAGAGGVQTRTAA